MSQLSRLGIVFGALLVVFAQYNSSKTPASVFVDDSTKVEERTGSNELLPMSEAGSPDPLQPSQGEVPGSAPERTPSNQPDIHYPILKITVPAIQSGKPTTQFLFDVVENEKPVLLSKLLDFLDRGAKNDRAYKLDEYDCKHFAYQLYQDAVKEGMAVRFVAMTIQNSPIGHAFNAFLTSDAGVVFVDFTSGASSKNPTRTLAQKNVVHAAPGDPYIRIPLQFLAADFRNDRADFFKQIKNTEDEWLAEKLQFIPAPFEMKYGHSKAEFKFERPSAMIHRTAAPLNR
jgi:hypothetical protein